jgi:hypothetical protein
MLEELVWHVVREKETHHRSHRGHRKDLAETFNLSLCLLCSLWLKNVLIFHYRVVSCRY